MAWIELENAVNVRDVGGLPTVGGGSTVPGRLVRSDNLQDLSPTDVTRLVDEVGVRTVIDLRSHAEVTSEGPGPLRAVDHVRHLHLSVLPESQGMTDAAADALALNRRRARERDASDLMLAFYLGYLEDRPDSIVGALRAIADAPGAALVHCAAGKDRTGVVVALALSVAGVRREVVVADYTATAERIDRVLDRLRSSPTYAEDVDRLPAEEHRPRAATMDRLLARLDSDHGGVLGWLAEHGFDARDAKRLRDKLLEV
ncbi:tyrosine-protein phosphatase [Actinophytocola gossypii]|uniref:Tyrosine-protein phosphatase n=1 Tax=Actinophytocola gossypii TaxID=2812003 RepID=A0ABT2JJP1_9PSEU|nr:tyrosine-protein phosphatase [Actinophytocola gossypii]MCT2588105.1 tyrosine-protein phosphatase [Actinophytocola gossypii]